MLENKLKKIILSLTFVTFVFAAFAATTDLSLRFLDKAELAYEQENVEEAYKYVNQALAVAKDESSQANVLYFARTVYSEKLQRLLKSLHHSELKSYCKNRYQPSLVRLYENLMDLDQP